MDDKDFEKLARRRAAAKMGWYVHALVFIAVNTFLAAVAYTGGRDWAAFPLLGWGFGLMVHGLAVFVFGRGSSLHASLVQRERAKLAQQRDAW